jgi:YVTN family beta-propeller protein
MRATYWFLSAVALPALNAVAQTSEPLPTGKLITPSGTHVAVGSYPAALAASPDGRFIVATSLGTRQFLSVIDTADGRLVSQVAANGRRGSVREGLYFGLAFRRADDGSALLYASRGAEQRVTVYRLGSDGKLTETASLSNPGKVAGKGTDNITAGVALSPDGRRVYAADNKTSRQTGLKGSLSILDAVSGALLGRVVTPGFPLGVAVVTEGGREKVYVTSERDSCVAVVDPVAMRVVKSVRTGASPTHLLVDGAGRRLFVANSGSDTVSVVDTRTDRVVKTIVLRPNDLRGLPGATPLGMALSPDESRLYIALADMNCVAVADPTEAETLGYIATGWYPSAVKCGPDGALFVANAKGHGSRNPNGKAAGPNGAWGQYILGVIEGSVSRIALPDAVGLRSATEQVLRNNRIADARKPAFRNPGIKHVIYVIKENRTYDQVFGDLAKGNGDPSLCLFPREVTPNHHALAERFVLMDNFYCCAEVSADGWNWSTSGMANEYTSRNSTYGYSGRGRGYDYEGDNEGVPVDLEGLPDVAASPGGYIWDNALKHGLSLRNFGFFVDRVTLKPARKGAASEERMAANKRALRRATDPSFADFDMSYADSDAWVTLGCPSPKQALAFGANMAPSRMSQWLGEFQRIVATGNMPRLMLIRLPRDHTAGATEGLHSPRAMVADNDYAVGQLVEAVSNSPFWKETAIVILEDDAQNGNDHVDAHRSPCLVISPYVERGKVDSRFYNTDSALRTIELLLGLPPMCQYDAVATPFQFFGPKPDNVEPYAAILPARKVLAEVNTSKTAGAAQSAKLNFRVADAVPDELLSDIVWHAVMGADTPRPPLRRGLRTVAGED